MGSEFKLTAIITAKRPFLLYLLSVLFLLAGAFSLVGIIGVFQAWGWWLSFTTLGPILFQVFLGILITLIWFSAALIIWLRLPWAIMYCSIGAILATVWMWIERIFMTKNPQPFSRHLLAIAVTCVFLIFVFSALYLVAPSMKPYHPSQKDGGSNLIQPSGEKNE
ncbi:MAG: hypothetical protein C0410_05675 [Anaerolinea sp.]|nr:hypothetical protein [Anaerolinea sp.]